MIGRWLRRIMGTDEMLAEIRAEREMTKELLGQVMRTGEVQAQAVNGMIGVLDRIYKSYETDGKPPEERHINEEMEDEMLRSIWEGEDSGDR